MPRTDVVILGGGPAGSAAAITCAAIGLRVTLLERSRFPRHAVGESLHPDVEPLLERLGVLQPVLAAGFLRHPGVTVAWDGPEFFEPFGITAAGPALGWQAWRTEFDAILLDRARELAVHILQPSRATGPILSGSRLVGITTAREPILARFTVDATGRHRVLGKWLAIPDERHGAKRRAWSGLAEGSCAARNAPPSLRADEHGWTWVAQVRDSTFAWTHLDFRNRRLADDWLPPALAGTTPVGPPQAHDVTWRLSSQPAGPGYFLVGDAAAVLDPAAAHGVLEALMSGMLAGHLIASTIAGALTPHQAAARYTQTVRDWFYHDSAQLSEFYQRWQPRPATSRIPGLGQGCLPAV